MSLTLADYAAAKKLDAALLTSWGLTEHHDGRGTYVRMPYRNELGVEVAVRMRLSLDGAERFRWRSGAKPCLYGLDRLAAARAKGFIVLVEGESDCQTLAQAGVPALGVPGAGLWNEARDARHFDGIEKIYVVIEGDAGGDTVTRWLAKSAIRERSLLLRFSGEVKDPSALYLADPAAFAEAFAARLAAAEPWAAIEAARAGMEETRAFALARELIETPDILARFRATLAHAGLVGEDRNASVLYLALTSRLLPKPVSIAYKGPSSGGKSYAVERVLAHFPHDARVAITSMSEKALIFMDDDLRHKHLVIAEAEGAGGEFQEYLIRSLLSEGRLEHRMAEKAEGAIVGRHVVKEGPTGLIITTTRVSLHPENETRLISLSANDTRAQTRAVLEAVATRQAAAPVAPAWPALQTWLSFGERRVAVPYARVLSSLVSDHAIRMRRDFGQALSLVEAHALLHRASRARDAQGWIVATLGDYAAVRALIFDVVSEGVAAAVPGPVREAVEAVRAIAGDSAKAATAGAVAMRLGVDKSTALRRCLAAKIAGYLVNEQTQRGREALYRLGEALPTDTPALPTVEMLARALDARARASTHDRGRGGEGPYPPETGYLAALPPQGSEAGETEGKHDLPPLPPAAEAAGARAARPAAAAGANGAAAHPAANGAGGLRRKWSMTI